MGSGYSNTKNHIFLKLKYIYLFIVGDSLSHFYPINHDLNYFIYVFLEESISHTIHIYDKKLSK